MAAAVKLGQLAKELQIKFYARTTGYKADIDLNEWARIGYLQDAMRMIVTWEVPDLVSSDWIN